MGLGDFIDAAIEPFAPRTAAKRRAARIGLQSIRKYDVAARDRRTAGWNRPSTGPNAENAQGIVLARNATRDLVRNNKYAAAGVRQATANMVGDGISPQFSHPDPKVARIAQDGWDRWAESKVDGFGDFYEIEKLAARGTIEGGETLVQWLPDAKGPDGRCQLLEGDFLDITKTQARGANAARIVQGVQFDGENFRDGYWMFDEHPGELYLGGASLQSKWVSAQHIDHVFERLRGSQVRGISWLAPIALTLRDIADIEDAVRLKKKVEACLALVLTPDGGNDASPLTGEQTAQDGGRPSLETLRPGMIFRTGAGEEVHTVNPSSTGDGVDFIRQQLAACSANLTPYYLMTGDTTSATYTSLRAANLGHHAMLDDWQQNMMIPRLVRPAVDRRLARMALETGNNAILQCRISYALPVRRVVDPVKDLMAEVIEIRAGLKLLSQALAERGINGDEHMAEIARMNGVIDSLGLALETDPRRLTDSGVLQAAAGYLFPKGEAAAAAAA